MKRFYWLWCCGLAVMVGGCRPPEKAADKDEARVAGDVVSLATNSPQLSALTLETVGAVQPAAVSLAGRLTWDEDATARVFTPFAGIVRRLLVDVNQPVARGQALAEILSADFGQAQADARKAQSDFRRVEKALARARDLLAHGAIPLKDLESAEADFASAEAERERTEARLAIYGATASSTERGFLLPSPLAGLLVDKSVNPGQEVRPDQMLANLPQITAPLFVVTDPKRLWIQIDATEAELPALQPGREFTFAARAFPGQVFTGRVEVVSQFIDPNTRTIKVRGTVENSRQLLKAEMFVSVSLRGAETAGASVPSRAIFLKGEKHYVFVEDQPGRYARREVKVGPEDGDRIVVVAGVLPGQRVVTEGCILLDQSFK